MNKKAFPKYLNLLLSIVLIAFFFVAFFMWYSYDANQEADAVAASMAGIQGAQLMSSYLLSSYEGVPMDELIASFYLPEDETQLRQATQAFFSSIYQNPSWALTVGDEVITQGNPQGQEQTLQMPLLSPAQTIPVTLQLP